MTEFEKEVAQRLADTQKNVSMCETAAQFLRESMKPQYSYNFFWQGRPIIQYPQDIVAMQELIWSIKPDLIIETGIPFALLIITECSTSLVSVTVIKPLPASMPNHFWG